MHLVDDNAKKLLDSLDIEEKDKKAIQLHLRLAKYNVGSLAKIDDAAEYARKESLPMVAFWKLVESAKVPKGTR